MYIYGVKYSCLYVKRRGLCPDIPHCRNRLDWWDGGTELSVQRTAVELRLSSFSFLRIHTGRGYVDSKKKRTADAIRARFRLHKRFWRFRDVRTKPKIPLPTILLSVLLMPLWSAGSRLALDRLARTTSSRVVSFRCTSGWVGALPDRRHTPMARFSGFVLALASYRAMQPPATASAEPAVSYSFHPALLFSIYDQSQRHITSVVLGFRNF